MYTIKQLTAAAKSRGIVRGRGTYNGRAYWKNGNAIVTRERLLEILGYAA